MIVLSIILCIIASSSVLDVRVKPFVLGLHKINCTKLGNYYDTDPMEAIANIFL